jgi:SAM-dependent methyltransferase
MIGAGGNMSQARDNYDARVLKELDIFRDQTVIHNLPDIAHYWSNTKIRPKQEALGFSSAYDMCKLYLEKQCRREPDRTLRFVSIGAGNCDIEAEFARHLFSAGHSNFVIECLDLNPTMLERGREAAQQKGVSAQIGFVQGDFNRWQPDHEYDAVLAVQSLHHVVNLEGLFRQVRASLLPYGRFIISDMIGRNGHQRWPEALEIVREFWKELPPAYRYNRMLKRYDEEFTNWDCSIESFEGIRSQDILPLLLNHFHFELFMAYGNVIDPFVDRVFGHNFDATDQRDRDFIDRVHQRDEEAMLAGLIKPVHMEAVVGKEPVERTLCHKPFTPEFCVRWPDALPQSAQTSDETPRLENEIRRLEQDNATLRQKLDSAESQMRMAADSRWLGLGNRLGLGPKLR